MAGGKIKTIYKWVSRTVKIIFIVFLLLLVLLYFREQRLPKFLTDRIADMLSSENVVLRFESAVFGLKNGVGLVGVKLFDKTKENWMEPVAVARQVQVNHFLRRVRIVGLRYPRLPDGYYDHETRERNERVRGTFTKLPEFRLVLEDCDILGIAANRVTADVNVTRKWIALDEIHVDWPDRDQRLAVDGHFRLDLIEQRVRAGVYGLAKIEHIRPLIETLDVTSALEYMDAFTELPEPVPARAEFDVNLVNNDFKMKLDLRPTMGRYRSVPMSRAEGIIDFSSVTRGTNCNLRFVLDLPIAIDAEGRRFGGQIEMNRTNGVIQLDYDVRSAIAFNDILTVADCVDPAVLSSIECVTPPLATMKGRSCVSGGDLDANDLDFSVKLKRGAVMGMKVNDLNADFKLRRDSFLFRDVLATGKTGGKIRGDGRLTLPNFNPDDATFAVNLEYRDGSLDELADFFKFDLGDRRGKVDGTFSFDGSATTNCMASLCGKGSVKVTEGHLAQMKLFAGLTALLADRVPGVGYLVNQSQASADFTVSNGVFRTENFYIEGGVISIKGWGSYDIVSDNLDCKVHVRFLKEESTMGKLVHPVTWPFTKLLLEFRGTGPIDSPNWTYVSLIDRMF